MRMNTASARPHPGFGVLLLLCLLALAPRPAAASDAGTLRGKHIIFVEPYGPSSATSLPLTLMRAALARATGASIALETLGGRAGGSTLDYLIHPPASTKGALVFGILDLTSRVLAETAAGRPALLTQVQPVALVSTGASAALVVPDASPIATFDAFRAAAQGRKLRIVDLGRRAIFGIELAMLKKSFGLDLAEKVVDTHAEVVAALASGQADAGFLPTYTLLPAPGVAPPPVRPLLTFAAEPNPDFAIVPTLKQRANDPKAGISTAIAVFAPPDMPKPYVAAMEAALAQAANDDGVQAAAMARHFPLEGRPATAVLDAMKRSERVIKAYQDYIGR
jgi:tripartite-type tricarboxylate transporter receptor subunit TctC